MKILISIKPEYVEKILSGEKHYEFRKRSCNNNVHSMLIYETTPVKKIVAEVEIASILEGSPLAIWDQTHDYAGISKDKYFDYFNHNDHAVAYVLGQIHRFSPPHNLSDYGIKHAPQSFIYLK